MEKKHYSYICIGSDIEWLGFAVTHGDTLLLEPSECVAGAWVRGIQPLLLGCPTTGEGMKAAQYFRDGHYVNERGELDVVSLQPAMAEYVFQNRIKVWFCTIPVKIQKEEQGYTVIVYTKEGLLTLKCDYVLQKSEPQTNPVKWFNVLAYRLEDNCKRQLEQAGCHLTKGFKNEETLVGIPCLPQDTVGDAIGRAESIWEKCFHGKEPYMDVIASDFVMNDLPADFMGAFESYTDWEAE